MIGTIEGAKVIARCDGCNAPMLTVIVPGQVYECSLYYATLRRTRPLKEGHEVRLPNGTKVEIRETPGFCSKQCFDVVTADPAQFTSFLSATEGPWLTFKGWEYRVLWDNRTGVYERPPLAPSALTFVRRR